jgi:anti-anti-sigma regulatory factor
MKTSEILNTLAPPSSTRSCQQTVIALEDIVDLESTPRLDALFQAACSGAERVTLDMSRLQLIDEAAIASVLRGMATLGAAGVDLHVRYPSPMALQLFEMCGPLQMLGVDFALDSARFCRVRGSTEVADIESADMQLTDLDVSRQRAEASR